MPCPVCSQEVAYVAINRHLDQDCNTPIQADEVLIVKEVEKKPINADKVITGREVEKKSIDADKVIIDHEDAVNQPNSVADKVEPVKTVIRPCSADIGPEVERKSISFKDIAATQRKSSSAENLAEVIAAPEEMKKRKSYTMHQPSKRMKRDSESFR